MKKVFMPPLTEILNTSITDIQEYLEQALSIYMKDFMNVSSGVITGLEATSGSLTTLSVASGSIFQDRIFGELEAASGFTISYPTGGVRTDLLVCYYSQVYDTSVSGYVILDVATGAEGIENNYTRQFGSVVIQQLTNTTYATRPSNKIPLAVLTLNSSGLTAIQDVRLYARVQRFELDIQQTWRNLFFAGMY